MYPYLQYCNVVWGTASKTALTPLVSTQKRTIRLINYANYRAHTIPLFKAAGILKLEDIHHLESLKFVFAQLMCPTVINFNFVSTFHSLYTRDRNNLRPPKPKSDLSKNFITYAGCILWNNLPSDLKKLNNIASFKMATKKHLLGLYWLIAHSEYC